MRKIKISKISLCTAVCWESCGLVGAIEASEAGSSLAPVDDSNVVRSRGGSAVEGLVANDSRLLPNSQAVDER